MTPTLTAEKAALLRKWREECRLNLLELEKKSIYVRVSVFEKIINEKTMQVNQMLCINTNLTPIKPYKHYTDIDQQCKFIENWNGLNTNQMRSLPKTLQEYENRAKNWLNGRRAINYAQNLFPEMILCAEHYAQSVSDKLFLSVSQTPGGDKNKRNLYCNILLYSYISGICCGRVALYDGHHRASLICENSIKKEGNLKRLLQKYFDGNEVQSYSFPKHLQDAIDYFKNKYHQSLNQFQTKYTHRITNTVPHNHNNNHNYSGSRGGIHIGSCNNYRNNPINNNNNNNCNNNGNNNIKSLPPPLPPFNGHNNNRHQCNNIQMPKLLNNTCPNNLMVQLNSVSRRNNQLEAELLQYREQQRMDTQKIKILEEQITLLQRQSIESNSGNSTSSTPSTNSDISTHSLINHSPLFKRDISTDNSTHSSLSSTQHIINNNNIPPLPNTITYNQNNNLNNNINHMNNMLKLNSFASYNNSNTTNINNCCNMNNMNSMNNMNNNVNNNMNMSNAQVECPSSPLPLSLHMNDSSINSYNLLSNMPIHTHNSQFEMDTSDHNQYHQ